jgi:hypothetical protein
MFSDRVSADKTAREKQPQGDNFKCMVFNNKDTGFKRMDDQAKARAARSS